MMKKRFSHPQRRETSTNNQRRRGARSAASVQHHRRHRASAGKPRTRPNRYLLFYKPYGVLSQFTREAGHPSLADFGPFPNDVYPVGRLDTDSEGVLLLTNDNDIKHRLTDPKFGHPRTYLAQVERIPTEEILGQLRNGIVIEGETTRPAEVRLLSEEPVLSLRSVPIRFRKNVPTAWIELTLREGRNRQVRKMTAAVGHPTLRLVRTKIGKLSLEGLRPGEWREVKKDEIL